MSTRWRLALLALGFAALIVPVWHVVQALPGFGTPIELYGPTVNELLPSMRHVTNMVAAVNFDVRGIDTLGEESMLVCAVTGAVVLLRGRRGEDMSARAGRVAGRAQAERADATILLCRIGASLILLFGIYMVLHGTVTPGGGFQGGVIAASSLMLLYLGEGYASWRALVRTPVLEILEGGGAFVFVAAAAVPLAIGYAALENILPFGQPKDLFSGGLMVIVNFAVGLSVTGSFALVLLEFMEETRSPAEDPVPDEED
ncbi:MAG TPA: MnhB domain-containing protein [Xanthobacteraceae bacterium]|jgi:multicomponent Na+:H+ antiporter subunit B